MPAAADDALRRFRHDIRSPLNVVLGFAAMLEDELEGEAVDSARHIRIAAEDILRLVEDLPGESGSPSSRTSPVGDAPDDGSLGGEVVLIEDHASNVRLVERILTHRPGLRLSALTDVDGVRAWLESGAASPVVVLLDRHLGRADGLDLIDAIRARHDGLRIVVVTADATDVARDEALTRGADEVVTKPFSVTELLDVVDRSSSAAAPH